MSSGVYHKYTGYHNRKSIRLRGYDYSLPGAYFVTLCVKNRECLFGKIITGAMQYSQYGLIAREKWEWLGQQYPYVKLDEYTVMPSHFHGILWIRDISRTGGFRRSGSRPAPAESIKIKPIGQIIGAFKTVSAKQINIIRNSRGNSVWQRDFYACPEQSLS